MDTAAMSEGMEEVMETALETGTAPTRYWHALEDAEQIGQSEEQKHSIHTRFETRPYI